MLMRCLGHRDGSGDRETGAVAMGAPRVTDSASAPYAPSSALTLSDPEDFSLDWSEELRGAFPGTSMAVAILVADRAA